MEELNKLSYHIIGAAFKVHSELGPGLLESTYETCMEYELASKGIKVKSQIALPVIYNDIELKNGYRVDLIVEDLIIVELKSVDCIAPIHKAQLMTYLKLANIKLGLLINFNVTDLKQGITRIIM